MKTLTQWLTPTRRQAIQGLVATLAPLLIMLGIGSAGQWEQISFIVGAVLTLLANLLNLVNVRVGDWGEAWILVRTAIYAAAATVVPALAALELFSADTGNTLVLGLSIVLAVGSAFVAIFTNSHEQKAELVEILTELEEYRG